MDAGAELMDGVRRVVLLGIRLYRGAVSPFLPPGCRFVPSCSAYAEEAVERHGVVRGLALAAARVWRCRPGGGQGCDPVPLRAGAGKSGRI